MTSSHLRRQLPLILLLVFTALARIGVIWLQWPELNRDPDAYRRIAENVMQRRVYSTSEDVGDAVLTSTAFRPPLYPLTLSLVSWGGAVTASRVAMLHVMLGVITVLLTYLLGRAWQLAGYSYLAAALVAVDPILLNQSSQIMTETLATMLAVTVLLVLTKWSDTHYTFGFALLAGIALGLASQCRPTFLVFAACCLLYATVDGLDSKRTLVSRAARAVTLGIALVVVLIPWGIRNQAAIGKFTVTTTHGGYTLLLGNNPYFYRHLRERPWGEVWDAAELQHELARGDSRPASDSGRSEHPELTRDRRNYEMARRTIQQLPAMFVYSSLVRIGRLWSPLPHRVTADESTARRWMRYMVAAWYLGTLVAAFVGALVLRGRLWRTPWVWALLLCFAFTAVHSVYWSNMRMRAPLMPAIYLLAVSTLSFRSAKRD